MSRSRSPCAWIALLPLPLVAFVWSLAQAEEYRCEFGAQVRRVELRVADEVERLPCQVVYWKDTERPGKPEVLWRADFDLDFCAAKTRRTVELLEGAGWQCAAVGQTPATPAQVPGPGPEAEPEVPTKEAARPRDVRPAPDEGDAPAAINAPRSAYALLARAVARDLRRLREVAQPASGRFNAEIADLGDLDHDGADDAVVLMTYRTADGGQAQYLMAYLFDRGDFRPAAKRLIEGRHDVIGSQDVGIREGTVDVRLKVWRPDDQPCCPSGQRLATFALEGGQLVDMADDDTEPAENRPPES